MKRKFVFRGGCNHCGKDGHERQECSGFLAIKAKHNELPKGYKGARERAFDKWLAEVQAKKDQPTAKAKAKPRGRDAVKSLTVQPDSSDSDFTDDEGPGIVSCITGGNWETVKKGNPVCVIANRQRIAQPIAHNNFWSDLDKINAIKTPLKGKKFTVRSEKDLTRLLDSHPTICAQPEDEDEKVNLASLAPRDKRYVYILIDSGASLHAANLDVHFPGHELEETDESRRRDYARTANDDKLFNLGSFKVHGISNGVKVTLGFTNMKVDIPVASVRTFVKSGNDVEIFEGGGLVRNAESGAELPFVEMGGVYFLKLRIEQPHSEYANPKA